MPHKFAVARRKSLPTHLPHKYTFDDVKYAPVMYKMIMRLGTIDSITTTQTLRDKLQNLMVFAAMVSGNIDKINTEFNSNYSQILA